MSHVEWWKLRYFIPNIAYTAVATATLKLLKISVTGYYSLNIGNMKKQLTLVTKTT
jgi:hypothetical protein